MIAPTDELKRPQLARLMLLLAAALGASSLLAFGLFLYAGSPQIIDLGLDTPAVLLIDACLSLAFFVQHSGMIRKSYRRWQNQFIPEFYHGANYSIASALVLYLVVVLWQESSVVLGTLQGGPRWLARATFLLAAGGILWSVLALKSFDTFGLEPIRRRLRAREVSAAEFVIRGPYRWVRHPQYTCILVMVWSYPDLTADRLVFNVLWSVWIVAGTLWEEGDLLAEFGQSYRNYQNQVPMLIPYRMPRSA